MDVSNVNGTHNLPPRPPSNTIAQTRQKIVEILAGTANGCLAELGYFPGMPQRLKELEHQNEQWKLENMKLYQDNASLLELIHQQNERIKQMHFPDSEKNVRIMELDAELQKTRSERDELARVQAAMNSTPSQLQQNFTHLQSDYIKVVNVYRILRAEVGRLQDQIRALAAPKYPSQPQGPQPPTQHQQQPQQPQQQSRPQVQQHLQSQHLHQPQPKHFQHRQSNCPPQRQSAPSLLQPHAQQQHYQPLLDLSRLQSVQQINPQLPPIFGQGQRQQHPLSQTQQAVLEQKPRFRQSSISGSMPGTRCFKFFNPAKENVSNLFV
ncbi:hypothetical protein BYT27DRAFT_6413630 [Phlegmacium glaucopus]|nr:hypothetical protein BYT27DRAFT_6413630 [Phlegmacium glaucopus]